MAEGREPPSDDLAGVDLNAEGGNRGRTQGDNGGGIQESERSHPDRRREVQDVIDESMWSVQDPKVIIDASMRVDKVFSWSQNKAPCNGLVSNSGFRAGGS